MSFSRGSARRFSPARRRSGARTGEGGGGCVGRRRGRRAVPRVFGRRQRPRALDEESTREHRDRGFLLVYATVVLPRYAMSIGVLWTLGDSALAAGLVLFGRALQGPRGLTVAPAPIAAATAASRAPVRVSAIGFLDLRRQTTAP